VRIVSLLPSGTEIVFALGLGDQLRGVTFECDHPAAAREVPQVSGTALPTERELTPSEIDAEVSARARSGEPMYTLDVDRIRAIDPELIITQDLCRVCAVPSGAVEEALDVMGCRADVVSLDPHSLDDVIDGIGAVGLATGREARAEDLMAALRARVAAVRRRVAGRRPRVLALEWCDPPFSVGHWVPEMLAAAGAEPLLAHAAAPSRRIEWAEIARVDPEVVLVMPCGFDLEAAVEQSARVLERPELDSTSTVFCVDANAYFSRPGPRVVDGIEILADLFHPRDGGLPAGAARVR
jgi:iron complex transport system substrate-binding protein